MSRKILSHTRALMVGVALFIYTRDASGQAAGPVAGPRPLASRDAKGAPKIAPPSQPSTPTVAEQNSKTQHHLLEGNWNIYWYGVNKVTYMNIAHASGSDGITTFMGGFATLDREACSTFGTVIDAAEAQYQDGPATRTISLSAYVIIRVQCKNSQIWIEAFGLPSGKVLMSGRASIIAAGGQRTYAPIALGR